jgi:hypothetical protein
LRKGADPPYGVRCDRQGRPRGQFRGRLSRRAALAQLALAAGAIAGTEVALFAAAPAELRWPLCIADSGAHQFRDLTDKAPRHGVFHSVPDLIVAIEAYLHANNDAPNPSSGPPAPTPS